MKSKNILGLVVTVLLFSACEKIGPQAPEAEEVLAEPLSNMTPTQMAQHIRGDEDFAHAFSSDEGLGPIYVANSCENCHAGDGKGHPSTILTRFAKESGGSYDYLEGYGGPQLQHFSTYGYIGEEIPTDANAVVELIAPAVTGLGFLDAVPDSIFINMADPNDLDGDGVSGVLSRITAPDWVPDLADRTDLGGGTYIGRYGRKSGAITLTHQTANAYLNDMGISSDYLTTDLTNPLDANQGDHVSDPEVSASIVDAVVFYLKTLKAPTRRDEADSDVLAGELLFANTGCESCHVSTLKTGTSTVTDLNEVEFHPYTDLLLHDMGDALNDLYTEGSATAAEWRTTPLWGLGLSKDSQGGTYQLLHDGRATTIEGAILYHGGEAEDSKTNYSNLSQSEKDQLIKFLESL